MDGRRANQQVRPRWWSSPLRAAVLAAVATAIVLALAPAPAHAAPVPNTALVLGTSVSQGTANDMSGTSLEEEQAKADGFTVTTVSDPAWSAMNAAQFAAYQVIIIGDPSCQTSPNTVAEGNAATWEPVVMSSGGNKVLIGTDPTYHYGFGDAPNADVLERNGIAYAGATAGATGLYLDLSCWYDSTQPGTPVPILDGLSTHGTGQFTAVGEGALGACATGVNIVASTGPTAGLTDADLSNWNCSVHEAFDKFPSDYTPLALAPTTSGFPNSYCANDVETNTQACGSPYIMVAGSGVTVSSNVMLTPSSQTLNAGGSASLVANVSTSGGTAVSGASVVFNVDSGPNVGQTFTGSTDPMGNTTFTYTDTGGAGTDSVSATYTDSHGVSQKATATVTWNVVSNPATALKFATQPHNARVGQVFSGTAYTPTAPPVTVDVVDGSGNIVTSSTAPVTVALQSNPGSATLGGTTTVNAVGGVATFNDLTVNKPGIGYTLQATSPSLTSATSTAFDVNTVAVACQENVNCSGTVSNSSLSALVTAAGNPNSPDAGTLTVSLNLGPELDCPGFKAQGIGWIYFNVSATTRSKTLAYTIMNPKAGPLSGFQLCFGAPYHFTTSSGATAKKTVWSNGTVEYVGLLPNCPTRGAITGPCITSRTQHSHPTTVTINAFVPAGLPGDPRAHG